MQYKGSALKCSTRVRSPDEAVSFARKVVRDHAREHFLALYLDSRGEPDAAGDERRRRLGAMGSL